jgi:hypothetical protein
VELICGVGVLGQLHDGVLERQEHAGIDLEGEVEVQRSAAALLGVEVDLPHLPQRIGLDEVALVMDVERVVHSVVLELGHVSGDVDYCHGASA